MLATALHLLPVLGAETEKNKTLFYVCGGLFALWAVIVSVGIGLRRPDFPGSNGGARIVISITVVLMLATMSAAVITSGPRAQAKSSEPASSTSTQTSSSVTSATPAPAVPSKPIALAADPKGLFKYDPPSLTAKAGRVTIEFMNASPVPHNVTLAEGSKVLGATPTFKEGKKTVTLNLKPGTYTFYCSVPGHRQAGMQGTLTVS